MDKPRDTIIHWVKGQFLKSNEKLKRIIELNYKMRSLVREDYVEDVVAEIVGKAVGDAAREKIISSLKQNKIPRLANSAGKIETLRWFLEDRNTQIIREDLIMRLE